MRRGVLLATLALLAVGGGAVGGGMFFNTLGLERRPRGGLQTAMVQRGEVTARIAETGSIEPATVVEIKSEQSGEITRLFVTEGETVQAGQRLAVVRQESSQARQAAQLRATLDQEALSLKETEQEVERQRGLFARGFVARKDLEAAEKARENAKIRSDLARRQLLLALGGNQDILRTYLSKGLSSPELDEFLVTAPLAGTVIDLKVQPGEIIASGTSTVTGGTVMMKIADLSKMIVRTRINEVNIMEVRAGLPAEIRFDAVSGRVYHGVVVKVAPQGERVNNIVTYLVTVEIRGSDSQLRPSMTANVDLITATLKDVLSVPLEAVRLEDGAEVVHVLEGGREVARRVVVRRRTATVAVIAEGLREGEAVVLPRREKT